MSKKNESACLVCGNELISRRGLCASCYEKYRREKRKIEKDGEHAVELWEDLLIERGQIASDGRPATNVFSAARLEIQQQIVAERAEDDDYELNRTPVGRKSKTAKKRPPRSANQEGDRKHG